MTRFLRSEAGAVVGWVLCSVLLAAVLVPWVYGGGKWLAAEAPLRDFPAWVDWLAAACDRARLPRFFNRVLVLSALALLPLLLRRLRGLRAAAGGGGLPRRARWGWRRGLGQWALGLVIAAVTLWGMGWVLEAAGAFEPKSAAEAPGASRFVSKALLPAMGASLLEEWVFRGLLLGLWLRIAGPWRAALGTSLFFAFVHFLEPPRGLELADPTAPWAGFVLLGHVAANFADPRFIAAEFLTLFAVGLVLAMARLRTGALWFSVGLHAGWIVAFKGFNLFHHRVEESALRPWWVGDDLKTGLVPLITLLLTGCLCHLVLRAFPAPPARD